MHAHKGALRLVLETEGVAAHGSTPERGRNAIYAMRRVLEHIEDDVAPALERARHPRLGPATINVGTILGGIQPNVVPARCRIEVDRRFLPGEREADMVRQAVGGLDVRHEVSHLYPPLDLDTAHPLARAAADACREALGHDDGFDVAPYATNAGFLDAAGVPALVFGPGSIAQAHADDEWVDLDEVVDAARVYAALIRGAGRWLGR